MWLALGASPIRYLSSLAKILSLKIMAREITPTRVSPIARALVVRKRLNKRHNPNPKEEICPESQCRQHMDFSLENNMLLP